MSELRLKFSGLLFFLLCLGFVACDKEATLEDVDNYIDKSIFAMEKDANAGRHGCVEFVFPLTIEFPDETSTEVDSYEELKETIRTWKENNPDADERPTLGFPLEVINQDGEVISIADKSELKELKRDCVGNHDRPGHDRPGWACFRPEFPFSIMFPDESVVEVNSKMELKQAVREWKQNNPDVDGRAQLVFPITVKFRDGTTIEVASKEELIALKEECRG